MRRLGWVPLAVVVGLLVLAATGGAATAQVETARALPGGQVLTGSLTGNRAGAFDFFLIEYPGGGNVVTIRATFAPGDDGALSGVGFNLFGAGGFLIGSSQPSATQGVEELLYASENAETWLVQVFNYLPDGTVAFQIEARGLPAPATLTPPATPPPAATPGAPGAALEPGRTVSGSLTGSAAGSFDRFVLPYPGDGSTVTLTMSYAPVIPGVDSPPSNGTAIGFNVYGPQGLVAASRTTDVASERVATFSSSIPGPYLLQVHNYLPGATITYSVAR